MITVHIDNNGVSLHGHAGHHVNGQDLVCAAVSALTCSLLHSLKHLSGNRIRAETGDGMAEIRWDSLNEEGKLLVDSWFLGIAAIDQDYHCITFV